MAKAAAASDSGWIINKFSISRMLISPLWYAKNKFSVEVYGNATSTHAELDNQIDKARIIVLPAHIIHCALRLETENEIE